MSRGTIENEAELAHVMRSLGYSPTLDEIRIYFKSATSSSSRIDFPAFLEILSSHVKRETKIRDEIMEAIKVTDHRNTGKVTVSELRQILCGFGERLTAQECESELGF